MSFLLTNDDGIDAPGISALAAAVESLGPAVVVAPDRHLSGCSHQTTTGRGLDVTPMAEHRYSVDGSPVDCTRVGLMRLAPETRWVLAGINDGGNLGADVYPSGTVAAAREACLLGRSAIAISQYIRRRPIDWQQSSIWTRHVLEMLLERPLSPGSFWNVNLPQPDGEVAMPEIVFCDVDPHPQPIQFELRDGKLHYGGSYQQRSRAIGHDIDVCFSGRIAISRIDLFDPGARGL